MPTTRIHASARTRFGELWAMSLPDLAEEAARACLDQCQWPLQQVDTLLLVSRYASAFNQIASVDAVVADALGFEGRTQFCSDLGQALGAASMSIGLGRATSVLVVAVDKTTDAPVERHRDILAEVLSPAEYQAGLTLSAAYGLRAAAYLEQFKLDPAVLSAPTLFAHARAVGQVQAQYPFAVTAEAIAASPVVSSPLRSLHLATLSDGAAAMLLVAGDETGGVVLSKTAQGSVPLALAERTDLSIDGATLQARQSIDLDVSSLRALELEDRYAIDALQAVEALGLALPGEGAAWYDTLDGGTLAVNATGGHKANGLPGAAGELRQFMDVANALSEAPIGATGLVHQAVGSGHRSTLHLLSRQ